MPPLPPNFWNTEYQRLLALLAPKLADAAKRGARGAGQQMGLGVNYQMSDNDATQWAQSYTDKLLQQLGTTTENLVGAELEKYFSTPGATLGDLTNALTPKLAGNAARANAIAVTEVTRAYSAGQRAAYTRNGVKRWRWRTGRDELVCFPAGTMISTENGEKPIEAITPGELVLTRKGYRPVKAVSQRNYSGGMTRITHQHGELSCTSNHPIWVEGKGWLHAENVQRGDILQTSQNQSSQVSRVFNFSLGDTYNSPSFGGQESILAGIALGVLVPMASIGLEGNTKIGYEKIDAVASNLRLLNIFNFETIKRLTNEFLELCFSHRAPIAGETAIFPICICGNGSEIFSACRAFNKNWRTTTFFRAIKSCIPFFGDIEDFPASFTGLITSIRQTAFHTAHRVAMGNRCFDRESLSTDWANLFRPQRSAAAFTGTEFLTALHTAFVQVKRFMTLRANQGLACVSGGVVAGGGTVIVFPTLPLFGSNFSTVGAFYNVCHGIPLESKLLTSYHNQYSNAITVYNLEVSDDPVYFANGILVHNCHICGPLNEKVVEIGQPFGVDKKGKEITEPPAHPNCRCFTVPVVDVPGKVEASAPEIIPDSIPAQKLRDSLSGMSYQDRRRAIADWIDSRQTTRTKPTQIFGMANSEDMNTVEWEGIKYRFTGTPSLHSPVVRTIDNLASNAKLPQLLKKHTTGIVFSAQRNKDDPHWEVQYNIPGFVSRASAGDTGKDMGNICVYNGADMDVGTTAHEMGHNLAVAIYGSPVPSATSDFMAAVNSGEPSPSVYANVYVVEDFAESVNLFITQNSHLQSIAPKRYNVIQELLRNAGYTG